MTSRLLKPLFAAAVIGGFLLLVLEPGLAFSGLGRGSIAEAEELPATTAEPCTRVRLDLRPDRQRVRLTPEGATATLALRNGRTPAEAVGVRVTVVDGAELIGRLQVVGVPWLPSGDGDSHVFRLDPMRPGDLQRINVAIMAAPDSPRGEVILRFEAVVPSCPGPGLTVEATAGVVFVKAPPAEPSTRAVQ